MTFLVEDYTPTENSYDSATENNFYIPNIDEIYHGVYSPEEPDYSDYVYETWNPDDELEFDPWIVLAQNRQALMDFASPVRQSDSSYVSYNELYTFLQVILGTFVGLGALSMFYYDPKAQLELTIPHLILFIVMLPLLELVNHYLL